MTEIDRDKEREIERGRWAQREKERLTKRWRD